MLNSPEIAFIMRPIILALLFLSAPIIALHCSAPNPDGDHNQSSSGEHLSSSDSPELSITRLEESESSVAPGHRKKLHLFILVGQSNMSGRGKERADSIYDADPNVYLFGNDYRWKIAQQPVDSSHDQLDPVSRDTGTGIDPSLSFARELRNRYPNIAVGLIPCAMGATTMFEWERRMGRDSLYGSCLYRAKLAASMGKLKAILFFQGEWDALDIDFARLIAENHSKPEKRPGNRIHYSSNSQALPAGMTLQDLKSRNLALVQTDGAPKPGQRERLAIQLQGSRGYNRSEPALWGLLFADFVDNIRADLELPSLPVIFAQIGDHRRPDVYTHWKSVQDAQSRIQMRNVSMIETRGLALRDSVHFTSESYVIIGQRFARAYLEYMK